MSKAQSNALFVRRLSLSVFIPVASGPVRYRRCNLMIFWGLDFIPGD